MGTFCKFPIANFKHGFYLQRGLPIIILTLPVQTTKRFLIRHCQPECNSHKSDEAVNGQP